MTFSKIETFVLNTVLTLALVVVAMDVMVWRAV